MDYSGFRRVARIYAVSHLIAGTLYIPFHKKIPLLCNLISDFLSLPLEPIPLPSEMFWFTLSVSMMYMIVYSAYLASKDEKNAVLWKVVIFSKATSTILFLIFFFLDVMSFAYIVGVLVDGPLFLIAFLVWKSYNNSKRMSS